MRWLVTIFALLSAISTAQGPGKSVPEELSHLKWHFEPLLEALERAPDSCQLSRPDNPDLSESDACTVSGSKFLWPVSGSVSSVFGKRHRKFHNGIDIAKKLGSPVRASRGGYVIFAAGLVPGYGNAIVIEHAEGYSTVYAHLSAIYVRKGQYVSESKIIGRVGNSGHSTNSHLHFEIRRWKMPVDPKIYLQKVVDTKLNS